MGDLGDIRGVTTCPEDWVDGIGETSPCNELRGGGPGKPKPSTRGGASPLAELGRKGKRRKSTEAFATLRGVTGRLAVAGVETRAVIGVLGEASPASTPGMAPAESGRSDGGGVRDRSEEARRGGCTLPTVAECASGRSARRRSGCCAPRGDGRSCLAAAACASACARSRRCCGVRGRPAADLFVG